MGQHEPIKETKRIKIKQDSKLREMSIRILPMIQERHKEMIRAKKTFVAVRETGIGVGAVPFILSVLAKDLPKPVRAVEKSIRRHERKVREVREVRKVRNVKKARENSVKVQPWKTERVEPFKNRKKEKRRKKLGKRRSGEWRVEKSVNPEAIADKLTLFVREKVKVKKRRVKGVNRKQERQAVRQIEAMVKKGQVVKKEKNQKRGIEAREKVIYKRLRFAWRIYELLKTERTFRIKKNRSSIASTKKHSETPAQREPPRWILLSIIWYLTMIREAGMQSTNQQVSQLASPVLPMHQQGVIFAFSS
jgi:hypothetical protein